MKNAEKRNLPITVWTVDNPRFVKRAIDLGIKAVITNNPAILLEKKRKIENFKNNFINRKLKKKR